MLFLSTLRLYLEEAAGAERETALRARVAEEMFAADAAKEAGAAAEERAGLEVGPASDGAERREAGSCCSCPPRVSA